MSDVFVLIASLGKAFTVMLATLFMVIQHTSFCLEREKHSLTLFTSLIAQELAHSPWPFSLTVNCFLFTKIIFCVVSLKCLAYFLETHIAKKMLGEGDEKKIAFNL